MYFANTPESRRLSHGDSTPRPATCRGITCSGQPCKRRLPSSQIGNLVSSSDREASHSTVSCSSSEDRFCWQHKNQAQISTGCKPRLMNSSETLVEKLQLLSVKDSSEAKTKRQQFSTGAKDGKPSDRRGKKRPHFGFARLCCFGISDREHDEPAVIVRHHKDHSVFVRSGTKPMLEGPGGKATVFDHTDLSSTLIPLSLTPRIRTQLLQELSKPISRFDECGYIYMFRQIDEDKILDRALSKSLRDSTAQEERPLRPSKMPSRQRDQRKILVKIGHTTNVQRRLSAWSTQCGVKIELLRYYPHAPSSGNNADQRKTPHCHRVERLIHLELADSQVKQKCMCGHTHREWFEIEASIPAVKAVDKVIRRWVSWAETSDTFPYSV